MRAVIGDFVLVLLILFSAVKWHLYFPHSFKGLLFYIQVSLTPSHPHALTLSLHHTLTPSHSHATITLYNYIPHRTLSLHHTLTLAHCLTLTLMQLLYYNYIYTLPHTVTPSHPHALTPSHPHTAPPPCSLCTTSLPTSQAPSGTSGNTLVIVCLTLSQIFPFLCHSFVTVLSLLCHCLVTSYRCCMSPVLWVCTSRGTFVSTPPCLRWSHLLLASSRQPSRSSSLGAWWPSCLHGALRTLP